MTEHAAEKVTTLETLRRAAALMRERAADAFHDNSRDLWTDMPAIDPDNNGWIVCEQRQMDVDWDTTVATLPYDYEGRVARHIASWHPAVALAVADWLDHEAHRIEYAAGDEHPDFVITPGELRRARAVAHAYLGEPRNRHGGDPDA